MMKVAEEQRAIGDLLAPEITELIEAKLPGAARDALLDLHDPEITEVLMALEPQHRVFAFRLLPRERAALVFSYFDREEQLQLIESLTGEQAAGILNALDPDDLANFFAEAPEDVAATLLAQMQPEQREQTERILEYPEESVGRIMTPDYLTIHPQWTVQQTIDYIRKEGRDAETLHTLYVVDDAGRLINHLSLRKLILANPAEKLSTYLEANRQTVHLIATDDREKAVHSLAFYDLPAMPVVDSTGVMVGIVTFDDVADVAKKEATEDMQKMGGVGRLSDPYLSVPILELIRKRGAWLAILLVGESLTVIALSQFQEQIGEVVALAMLMPIIMASGGNSGSQAASLVIRAMAVGELTMRDWWNVVRRELMSGVLMGVALGTIGVVIVYVFDFFGGVNTMGKAGLIATTIFLSLIGVVTCGTMVGSMLPFILRRLGLDPAAGSTPMVATVVDVTGLLIYFTIAIVMLF